MPEIIRRNAVTLAIFAAVTTGITATVNSITRPVIQQQHIHQQKILLDQVVPAALYNNVLAEECYVVTRSELGNGQPHHLYVARQNGQPVAAALETTAPDGYAGAIQLMVGADFNGKILAVRVTEHHETPGLGDKIELPLSGWINQLSGRHVTGPGARHFAVKKDGGDIDQFTGATITPRAVVNATRRAALLVKTMPAQLTSLSRCGANDE